MWEEQCSNERRTIQQCNKSNATMQKEQYNSSKKEM
jgi:hypothetical protein